MAMSPGTALRNLQQAQAGLRKARQALRLVRDDPDMAGTALKAGWESLAKMHRILAEIPLDAANEPVLSKQLSVERYGTALLVRLRRLARGGAVALDDDDADDLGDDDEN